MDVWRSASEADVAGLFVAAGLFVSAAEVAAVMHAEVAECNLWLCLFRASREAPVGELGIDESMVSELCCIENCDGSEGTASSSNDACDNPGSVLAMLCSSSSLQSVEREG